MAQGCRLQRWEGRDGLAVMRRGPAEQAPGRAAQGSCWAPSSARCRCRSITDVLAEVSESEQTEKTAGERRPREMPLFRLEEREGPGRAERRGQGVSGGSPAGAACWAARRVGRGVGSGRVAAGGARDEPGAAVGQGSSGRVQDGHGTGTLEKVQVSRKFRKANRDTRGQPSEEAGSREEPVRFRCCFFLVAARVAQGRGTEEREGRAGGQACLLSSEAGPRSPWVRDFARPLRCQGGRAGFPPSAGSAE